MAFNIDIKPPSRLLLLTAALAFCPLGAQAAQGFRVDQAQEAQITHGMNVEQVRQLLGHPTQQIKYRNQPGPTFTYRVIGTVDTVFDVDFDANGQVASTTERIIPLNGDSAHDR